MSAQYAQLTSATLRAQVALAGAAGGALGDARATPLQVGRCPNARGRKAEIARLRSRKIKPSRAVDERAVHPAHLCLALRAGGARWRSRHAAPTAAHCVCTHCNCVCARCTLRLHTLHAAFTHTLQQLHRMCVCSLAQDRCEGCHPHHSACPLTVRELSRLRPRSMNVSPRAPERTAV